MPPDLKPFAQRRDAFADAIGDAVALIPAAPGSELFRQDSNFHYLTGFDEPDAVALINPGHGEERFVLFVRPRDPLAEQWEGSRVGPEGAKELFGADAAYPLDQLDEKLFDFALGRATLFYALGNSAHDQRVRALLERAGAARLLGHTAPTRLEDPGPILSEMRMHKSADEIERLRRACDVSAEGHAAAMRAAAPGMHEYELQAELEAVFRKNGSPRNSYPPIVGSGPNACILHYSANTRQMNDGDLVLIDAGAEVDYMCGDISRTFPVGKDFTKTQLDVYEIVLAAWRAAVDAVKPGAGYRDFDIAARRVLTEGLVELGALPKPVAESLAMGHEREFYPHGTGHSLGIDTHDGGPMKVNGRWRSLEAGMVFTIEPGLYFPPDKTSVSLALRELDPDQRIEQQIMLGAAKARALDEEEREKAKKVEHEVPPSLLGLGIRIEDDVLVTDEGCEILTEGLPREADDVRSVLASGC